METCFAFLPFPFSFESCVVKFLALGRPTFLSNGQERILLRFKVFSAHRAISQALLLITLNLKFWIFWSLIFVISAQSELFFFCGERPIAFFQRRPMTQHSLV